MVKNIESTNFYLFTLMVAKRCG